MGITIKSKRYKCDMGYGGFGRFRNIVAEKINDEFYKHYLLINNIDVIFSTADKKKEYFEKYNKITKEFIVNGKITLDVANFLYKSDCEGKIDRKQAKQIFKLIKDCDDNIALGYSGRKDCAKMLDMKKIFSDNTSVQWC